LSASIVIGICTFKRPMLLEKALISVENAVKPADCQVRIVVADNDETASASVVVNRVSQKMSIPVYLTVEKTPGIPFARNRILKKAEELGADVLVFIDDDEYVDLEWLDNLWAAYCKYPCDALIGFVRTIYPDETPAWIVQGNFFQRDKVRKNTSTLFQAIQGLVQITPWDGKSNKQTGQNLKTGRTGNSLINFRKVVLQNNLRFDETFGVRGGSDAEFFFRVSQTGMVIRWVEDAVVNEPLPEERMTFSYFIKRNFKTRNYAHEIPRTKKGRVRLALRGSILGAAGCLSLPINVFRRRVYFAQSLKLIVTGVALVLSSLKFFIIWEEYRH